MYSVKNPKQIIFMLRKNDITCLNYQVVIYSAFVRRSSSFSAFRWISLFLLMGALILLTLQLVRFSRVRANFPEGMIIANVPVGGLDRNAAAQRLLEVYSGTPIEIHYGDAKIQMQPSVAEFKLEMEKMLAAAELERSQQPFWVDFWNYLWGRKTTATDVPLSASFSENRLRQYLQNEIAIRYDKPASPAIPLAGTVNFSPGENGTVLDIDRSVDLIDSAFRSISQRVVELPLDRSAPPRPSIQNLEVLLKQIVDQAGFNGLVGVYLKDLQTGEEINFAYREGETFSVNPDVAYTAASIIKIPIMVSAYRRLGEDIDPETANWLTEMIEKSGNDPADWLMERVIDPTTGPLKITEDMKALGLDNTFLAGEFYPGAPLLSAIQTPANQRTDLNTDPDLYNQTTPSDIGMLLEDIYQCSLSGGGALTAVFPGEITQKDCQAMIDHLS
jgi:hypothetical protein